MPTQNVSEKVKLRIDLPNEKKPFFNRVTSVENALAKINDAGNSLKKDESLNLKFDGQEKTVSKLELKDFSMEKLLDMLPKTESINISQENQQEPKFNAVVALFDISQDNPKLESKQDFVNLNFEGVLDVLAENEVLKSMQKDENSFSSKYQEEMDATSTGYQIEDVLEDNFNNLDNKEKYFSKEMFNKENTTKELKNNFVKPENLTDNQKIFINDVLNVASTLAIASTETARYLNDKFFDVYEKEIFSTDDFYNLHNSEKNNDFNKIIESSGFKYGDYGISRNENYTAIEEMAKKSIFVDSFKFLADNYPIINSATQTHFSVLAEMLENKNLQELKNPLVIVNGKEFPLNERNLNEKIKQMQEFLQKKEDLSQSNYNYKFQAKSDNGFETTMILNVDFDVNSAQNNLREQYSKFNEEKSLKNEIGQITDKFSEPQKQSFDFLSNHLKYLGFGENNLPMQLDLAKKIQSNENDFSIKHTSDKGYFKTNDITFDINFHKSKSSDKIFLNSYDVNLKNEKKGQDITHNFNVSKFGFTQKEAVNLIEGRSVKTDLKLQNGETEKNVFIRLDFSEKEANGNFKTKKFFEGYGVNTNNILQKNSAFFKDADIKDKVIKSLEKGNVVPVLFKNGEGKTQSLNAILSPESKSLQLYNNRMERVNITETLSNSAKVEQSETKQHTAQHTNKLTP